jgi:hypothetical protein
LEVRQQRRQAKEIRIAKYCVARALRSLGRIEQALAILEPLLAEHQSAATSDGYVFEELAECNLLLTHTEKAREFFALAHAELSKDPWLTEGEPARLARLAKLAQ